MQDVVPLDVLEQELALTLKDKVNYVMLCNVTLRYVTLHYHSFLFNKQTVPGLFTLPREAVETVALRGVYEHFFSACVGEELRIVSKIWETKRTVRFLPQLVKVFH